MDLPTTDLPEEVCPLEEVQIRMVTIDLCADRRRAKIMVELTSFQNPPDLTAMITDQDGTELVCTNIIGVTSSQLTFTMHLPKLARSSECLLHIVVEHRQQGRMDEVKKSFKVDNPSSM